MGYWVTSDPLGWNGKKFHLLHTILRQFFQQPFSCRNIVSAWNLWHWHCQERSEAHAINGSSDKALKRGDHEFRYSDKAISCKWFDNRAVHLLGSNVEGFDAVSVVSRRQKGAATKVNVSCPAMAKIYNHGMSGVELMDQYTAAYRLDRRARFRFYLRIFFSLWDVGCANSYIAFNQIFPKRLEFLDYKIAVGKALIGAFCSRERSFPSANDDFLR